jgi:serine protease Do
MASGRSGAPVRRRARRWRGLVPIVVSVVAGLAASPAASAADSEAAGDLPALWAERIRSTVAVEYVTVTEVERHATVAYGTVIDANGTIVLPAPGIDLRIPLSQLKDFKVYRPNDPDGAPAEYLGRDPLTGWHFVRAAASIRRRLVPVTVFAGARPRVEPALAEAVWGIALRSKEEDFAPYILQSHVALIQALPQRTAITQQEVSGPGLPVFDRAGRLLGLGASSFGQTFIQFSNADRGGSPIMLVNVEESSAFLVTAEVLPYLGRVPHNVQGRPLSWLGAYGLEPMDREVASFLRLGAQSGAVVSEVVDGSPASRAGLRTRDIILAVDGRPLPRFRPDRVVVTYFDRLIAAHAPGDTLVLSVLRGSARVEVRAVLADEPKLPREAERSTFEKLGLTAREFVPGDGFARHAAPGESGGFIASFVRSNGPADAAGLRPEDWVRQIDGVELKTFAEAIGRLTAITADPLRAEVVLLVSRGGDTAVLRLKLR